MVTVCDTYLKMTSTLTPEEMDKFEITDTLGISDFHGYCYKLLINPLPGTTDYTFDDLEELAKNHPDDIECRDVFVDGIIKKEYYVNYKRQDIKPFFIPKSSAFNKRKQLIELIIQDGPYFCIHQIAVQLSPGLGTLACIETIFKQSDIDDTYHPVLNFISRIDRAFDNGEETEIDTMYNIGMFNDKGKSKIFEYPSYTSIYNNIVSVRIVGEE